MSIDYKTLKKLWGRSGDCCSFPGCKTQLIQDIDETHYSIIGQNAHIVAEESGGPRGNSDLPIEQLNEYSNLILLCSVHHKIVDDHPDIYTVEILKRYKEEHVRRSKENSLYDDQKQSNEEKYSGYLDDLVRMTSIDTYSEWVNDFLSPNGTKISKKLYDQYSKIPPFVLSRIWSNIYPNLENAFLNIGNIAKDILYIFEMFSEDQGGKYYYTERFYKKIGWDPPLYDELLRKYKFHVFFLTDLTFEYVRALNYLFDNVREFLLPAFRIKEGALLIQLSDLDWKPVSYRATERIGIPYPGWKEFLKVRSTRDLFLGEGSEDIYTPKYDL